MSTNRAEKMYFNLIARFDIKHKRASIISGLPDLISSLATGLSPIMPSEQRQQHRGLIESAPMTQNDARLQLLLLQLFCLSNNLTPSAKTSYSNYFIKRHDEAFVEFFRPLANSNPEIWKVLQSSSDPVVQTLMQHIFSIVLRSGEVELLRLLLATGASPDTPVFLQPRRFCSPLKCAILHSGSDTVSEQMIHLLLLHGAKIDQSDDTYLEYALSKGKAVTARLLIKAGVMVRPGHLC